MNRLILFILCLSTLACNKEENNDVTDQREEAVQAIIDSLYKVYPSSTGLMLHVESPKNGLSYSSGAGFSDRDAQTAIKSDQPALIASSIKTYVAASILRLQEEGKLTIEDSIGAHLTEETSTLFRNDGYKLDEIKIKHLLSHTSGIADYVNDDYFDFINKNQTYRWTREEQMALATRVGDPLGEAQSISQYADVNYLLATEIIEQLHGKPFFTAMGELLKFEELGLNNTWFPSLEEKPAQSEDLIHQYWDEEDWGGLSLDFAWDSKLHDLSWDLYGGGGIAASMKDMARFSYHLFNGDIIEDEQILQLIKEDVVTSDGKAKTYRLGLAEAEVGGFKAYGHGGFWGTIFFYIPDLDTSLALSVSQRKDKMNPIRDILNIVTGELAVMQTEQETNMN